MRLNLIFIINKLSEFYYNFIIRYLNAINRIFKYIIDIIKYNLRFYKKEDFIVYLNSIYNNDKTNKKFIYKYILLRN